MHIYIFVYIVHVCVLKSEAKLANSFLTVETEEGAGEGDDTLVLIAFCQSFCPNIVFSDIFFVIVFQIEFLLPV